MPKQTFRIAEEGAPKNTAKVSWHSKVLPPPCADWQKNVQPEVPELKRTIPSPIHHRKFFVPPYLRVDILVFGMSFLVNNLTQV